MSKSAKSIGAGPAVQRGAMLIEVLIGLVIFMVGALGMMGFVARSMNDSVDSKYRTQAALLANQYYARLDTKISSTDRSAAIGPYTTVLTAASSAMCTTWQADSVGVVLPGATSTCVMAADGSSVIVTIQWSVRAAASGTTQVSSKYVTQKPII